MLMTRQQSASRQVRKECDAVLTEVVAKRSKSSPPLFSQDVQLSLEASARNYRGPTTAPNCWHPDFVEYLSHYRINVCFENSFTPSWFTEKFVNAARAGCVPVYRAHFTVRDTFLRGTRWVDPADFAYEASATLAAAESCDAVACREQNYQWLKSKLLRTTEGYTIWTRIADYFVDRLARS